MIAGRPVRTGTALDTARRHRAEMGQAVQAFAEAVAAPATSAAWRSAVATRLAALRERLQQHVVVTEGTDGLYAEMLEHAPRLSRQIAALTADHRSLEGAVDTLARRLRDPARPVERLRPSAEDLLAHLSDHRQQGADLVYEAYTTDIGGET
jgi:hypothetical protein